MVLFTLPLYAQEELLPLYDSLFQTKNQLINGRVIQGHVPGGNGHPYFGPSGWQSGIIVMEGKSIPCEAIRYDLLTDQLLIQHFSKSGSYVIRATRDIARVFELGSHTFCFLDATQVRDSDFGPGYFETVYKSDTELWIKWEKIFTKGSSGSGRFEQTRSFCIMKDHSYYRINGRKSLLDVFQDIEAEIKEFLKEKEISVRRAGIDDLIAVIRFYDDNKKTQP